MRFWVKTEDLPDNTYFINTGTLAVYYKDGYLQADAKTPRQDWHAQTRRFDSSRWQKVDVSWSQEDGLELYVNNEKMAADERGTTHAARQIRDYNIYFGRPNSEGVGRYTDGYLDEVKVWYAIRDVLKIFGLLDRKFFTIIKYRLRTTTLVKACSRLTFYPLRVRHHRHNVKP